MDLLRYLQHCDVEIQLTNLIDDVNADFGWKPINTIPKVVNKKVIIGGRWNLPKYPGYKNWTETVVIWSSLSSNDKENNSWFVDGTLSELNNNIKWTHWRPYVTIEEPNDKNSIS